MGALVLTRKAGERLVFTDTKKGKAFVLKVMHFNEKEATLELTINGNISGVVVPLGVSQNMLDGTLFLGVSLFGQLRFVLDFPRNIAIARSELTTK